MVLIPSCFQTVETQGELSVDCFLKNPKVRAGNSELNHYLLSQTSKQVFANQPSLAVTHTNLAIGVSNVCNVLCALGRECATSFFQNIPMNMNLK